MTKEESLDPKNWEEVKKLGYKMIDDMVGLLQQQSVPETKVWQAMPETIKKKFTEPIPKQGTPLNDIYNRFKTDVLPYKLGNINPRFWGWVIGTGTITGAFADFLASNMNSNAGGFNQSATFVEEQVINWAMQMFGLPKEGSGLLTTGGSMANFLGLAVGRNVKLSKFVRTKGMQGIDQKVTIYGSSEMHSSILKAVEFLGIGSEYLRKIPVDANFKINIDALEQQIQKDKKNGLLPICLIGNAGTVNTGAFDDMVKLHEIATRENMWFHVDGAFGAIAYLTPDYKHLTKGLSKADSLSFDFHKWMYVNYEVGCVLIRDKKQHFESFNLSASYLVGQGRGVAHNAPLWSDYGMELSRNFKALKVWMNILEHGIDRYGKQAQQNIEQSQYLKSLIEREEKLEIMAPVESNIVVYRYKSNKKMSTDELNKLNGEILITLQNEGIAVPSYTTLNGNYVLRVANVNHRSTKKDFDLLIKKTIEIGDRLAK